MSSNISINLETMSKSDLERLLQAIQNMGIAVNTPSHMLNSDPSTNSDQVVNGDVEMSVESDNMSVESLDEEYDAGDYEIQTIRDHRFRDPNDKTSIEWLVSWKKWRGIDFPDSWVLDKECCCEELIRSYLVSKNISLKTIYLICRVSTKSQTDEISTSLDSQEKEMMKNVEILSKFERIKIVRFHGSAWSGIPPQIRQVYNCAMPENAIMVWRVDRLTRNLELHIPHLTRLRDMNVKIYSSSESLEFGSNRLPFLQAILIASEESETKSQRLKQAYKAIKERDGKVGRAPYGYRWVKQYDVNGVFVKKEQKIDPIYVDILHEIVTLYKEHKCCSKIVKELNNKGLKKNGKVWTNLNMTSVLDNLKNARLI